MAKDLGRQLAVGTAVKAAEATERLFGGETPSIDVVDLPIDKIDRNPKQPRTFFDEAAINALADSIRTDGLLHPITVIAKDDGRYMIAAGERRWRAHRALQKDTIAAVISEGDIHRITLSENIQSQGLHPTELARFFHFLVTENHYNNRALAALTGYAEPEISRLLALLDLPEAIFSEYSTSHRHVSKSALAELIAVANPDRQIALWQKIKDGDFTVKSIRSARQQGKQGKKAPPANVPPSRMLTRLAKSVDVVANHVREIRDKNICISGQNRQDLEKLRSEIDDLLGATPAAESPMGE